MWNLKQTGGIGTKSFVAKKREIFSKSLLLMSRSSAVVSKIESTKLRNTPFDLRQNSMQH